VNKLYIALGTLALFAVVAWRVYEKKQTEATDDAAWVAEQKQGLLAAMTLCDQSDETLAATYALATTHLAAKAAVDRKAAARLIRDTVRPVLETRVTVCAGADALATNYLVNHPDPELRKARDETRAHLARLHKAGSTLDKLTAALDGNASAAEVGKLVTTATTPPK
jgi:hypothetical protein